MSCCPPGSHPAAPTTSDLAPISMAGTPVFFYDNPSSHTCVLVVPDIYGPDSGRTKDNCRALSAHYKVALLDVVDDYFTAADNVGEKLAGWVTARPFSAILPKIQAAVSTLQSQHGVTKFAAMGYCWGSWVVGKYAADASSVLTAGVHCHPSWVLEQFFSGPGSGEKIAEHITSPQLFLAAGNDPDWVKAGGAVHTTLAAKPFGARCKFVAFETMVHGWMCRGDISNPAILEGFNAGWHGEIVPFLAATLQ
ncbi:hypothetical protein SDRG_12522 [Saprolegnia diclina VS20]|uniref:Dienelactone hydrolase domain-containing protein n=1 Tax=Saprolegnia diclina (strain VS20) TaxID=1156394 RepID=T0Q8E5_SAPDV|nr:hypothetical protein SDRG_12522 [Saprolegnia diclina VS20]EQC29750.1 hypothetical protein SDRG_12522 [Saprolegnia diclina VS20]|eukprot:XP_008616816.1 hypothetical protein SDRG_12522 [Saprolegnia diclina VS20]